MLCRVLIIVGASVLFGACDENPPNYLVQDSLLRLVPEEGSIDRAGGQMFVLVELTRPTDAGQPVVTVVSSDDATLKPLPGSTSCALDAGDGGTSHEVSLAYAELLNDTVRSVRESGIQMSIPPGDGDVVLVGASYSYQGDASTCGGANMQLVAFASIRITRTAPVDLAAPMETDASSVADGGDMSVSVDAAGD